MASHNDKKNIETSGDISLLPNNNEILTDSIFIKDKSSNFIYQKIKKISAAIYIITNFFGAGEPLYFSLRDKARSLIIEASEYFLSEESLRYSSLGKLNTTLLEVASLLDICAISGMLSEMNRAILRVEIEDVHKKIEALYEEKNKTSNVYELVENTQVKQEFLYQNLNNEDRLTGSGRVKKNVKDIKNVLYENVGDGPVFTSAKFTDTDAVKDKLRVFRPVAVKKNKRQSAIIGILRRKKEVTVKDLVSVVVGCGEKTIQRELNDLIRMNLVRKKGGRRWTKYSLV